MIGIVPLLHDGSDHTFRFPIRSWSFDFCESLLYLVLAAFFHEGVMSGIPSILLAIVGIVKLDGVCTFLDNLFEKLHCGVLGFVGKNCGEQLARIVVDRHKQIFPSLGCFLMLQQGKPFRVTVNHLAGIVLVVPLPLRGNDKAVSPGALTSLQWSFLSLPGVVIHTSGTEIEHSCFGEWKNHAHAPDAVSYR